jgi:hypothetical protein
MHFFPKSGPANIFPRCLFLQRLEFEPLILLIQSGVETLLEKMITKAHAHAHAVFHDMIIRKFVIKMNNLDLELQTLPGAEVQGTSLKTAGPSISAPTSPRRAFRQMADSGY